MKKRLLFLAIMIIAVMSVLAITASAENNIIKLNTLPTLEQIHANPEAYISHLDEFDKDDYKTYREKDSNSVIVFSDLDKTAPTYYVYPAYYFIRNGSWNAGETVATLNNAISTADSTAFAGYTVMGRGGSLYYIRVEMPTYVTTLSAWNKFEGSTNLKELYCPTHIVEDAQTGKLKEVAYLTTIKDANIFSSCSSLEVIHNIEFLPAGINNGGGFSGCKSLKHIKLPEGITSIATEMFSGCKALETIEIPYGVTSIGANAFENCDSIKKITLPNSVVSFNKKSFAYMDNLEEINFGAGLTNIYSSDDNCENLDGCSKLKYVYLPATFATTVQGTGHNILATGINVTLFFTGTQEQAEALKTKLTTSASNDLIKNATLMDYTAEENKDIDFMTYAQTQGKTILVYNYNECEAFYNNVHNYQNQTGNCLDGVTCEQCGDNVTTFAQHNMKETLVYAEFIGTGIYNKFCANASNCTNEKVIDREAPAIFRVNETSGFSTDGKNGIAFGGFVLDADALDEYNRINSNATVKYGVILINPDYLDGKSSFFQNGEVNADKGFLQTDMSNARYANISISITGFTGKAQDMSLILAIYAYTDVNEVEYIQSKETVCGSSKVTLGTERLYAVTFASVNEGNKTLADLGEYVMPSQKENA